MNNSSIAVSKVVVQNASIAFTENNNLVTDEKNAKDEIKSIIEIYNRLYLAIGGYIKKKKSKIFL